MFSFLYIAVLLYLVFIYSFIHFKQFSQVKIVTRKKKREEKKPFLFFDWPRMW